MMETCPPPSRRRTPPQRCRSGRPRGWATRSATQQRVNLIEMVPRGDLSSTGYALVSPGSEYLVLQPSDTPDAFTIRLAASTYTVEWYSVNTRDTMKAAELTVASLAEISFTAPFAAAGPAVLYLRKLA